MSYKRNYVRIRSCKQEMAWYSDKIGKVYKVYSYETEPDMYMVRLTHRKDRAQFGVIMPEDGKLIRPGIVKRALVALGFH